MMRYVGAAAVAAISLATSAQAVTISATYQDSFIGAPTNTNAVLIQGFNTNADTGGNGIPFGDGGGFPVAAPAISQSSQGAVRVREANAANPLVDDYLQISQGNGQYGLQFGPAGVQYISFLLGSLEATNQVVLNFASGTTLTLTGESILDPNNMFNFSTGGFGRVTYDFGGTDSLLSILFRSQVNNVPFEIDEIYGAVPEPAAWAMMILGFGFAGWQLRSRKTKVSVAYA
jgi:PEP-CTERM motif